VNIVKIIIIFIKCTIQFFGTLKVTQNIVLIVILNHNQNLDNLKSNFIKEGNMKYLIKLNGKTISTRVRGGKAVSLKIVHGETTGTFKVIDVHHTIREIMYICRIDDNPNVLFFNWTTFKKVGDNYVAEFNYSPIQQKIDLKKQSLNLKYQEFQSQFLNKVA
jgi:hypothetical protein